MARSGIRDIVFGLAAAGLLMGCVEGGGGKVDGGAGGGAGLASAPAKARSGAQDVEAPEVFQTTDSALWDGRPSLGGIWVASPDVVNPERVTMFNPATGKSITGALFKRERDNPGPKLQLSSDAADALGILAGQPTEIKVTALRKEEAAEAPAPEVPVAAAAAAADAAASPDGKPAVAKDGSKDAAKSGDAAAIASAALAAVDAGKSEAKPNAAAPDPNAKDAAVAGAVVEGAAATAAETPKRKTWKERRAEAKAAREAKKQAAAEAKAAAAAAAAGTVMAPGEAQGEAPTATPDTAAPAAISSAPLDARKPEVAAGNAEKPKRTTVAGTAPKAAAPTAAPTVAADPAPPVAGGPVRPIQVASFSKEDNANRAAQALAKIGITATPQKSEKGGKAVWGVIVKGDEAMLKKIKDAGFADAYFLK